MDAGQWQGRRAGRMGGRLAVLGAAAAAAGLAAPPMAQAGPYSVDVCRDGTTGAPVGIPSGGISTIFTVVANNCLTGGTLRGQLPSAALPPGDPAEFGFKIPGSVPNARITRIQTSYVAGDPAGNDATVQLATSTGLGYTMPAPNTLDDVDKVPPPNTKDVIWRITCQDPGADCVYPSATAALAVVKARLTVEESALPTGRAAGGALLQAGAQAGTRPVLVDAADADAGVRRVTALLGGTAAGTVAPSCVAASWSPCPKALTALSVPVDTTVVADGTHPLTLRLEDAAGNTDTVAAGSVTVDNVPPPDALRAPALAGAPVQGQTLVIDPGTWDGHGRAVALELRWQRSHDGATWVDATPATGDASRYGLASADVGLRIRAVVRASSTEGSREVVAGTTGPVAPAAAGPDGGAPGGGTPAPAPQNPPAATAPTVVVLPPVGGAPAPGTPAPGALNSASGRAATRLAISVVDRRRAARMRYGAATPVTGTLRDAGNLPVPGARVEVLEIPVGGGAARPVATVVTDAAGRFSYRPRTGPSRTLRFAYRAHHGDVSSAITQEVALRVRAAIRLRTDRRALRNRQLVTFRGTVLGTSGRKLVELQVRRGSTWMTFATTFTRQGAFRYRYRFMRTFATARFDFRARVRKDDGFAYETAASARVRVLVRGAR